MSTDKKYRIVLVTIGNSPKEYSYLCEFDNVKPDDLVLVEGIDIPVRIKEVKDINVYNSNDISLLKKVIEVVPSESVDEIIDISVNDKDIDDSESEDDSNDLSKIAGTHIVLKLSKYFSYIDYHTDCYMKKEDETNASEFSLIKEIKIINNTPNEFSNVKVCISFSNEIFSMKEIYVKDIESFEEYTLRIPFLKVNKNQLETIVEQEPSSVRIELYNNENNELISYSEETFFILPISQPSPLINYEDRLYAKYVTPNASSVKQISLNAISFNDNKPIIAYQNTGSERINKMLKEAQSLYLALHNWGIMYQNPPAGTLLNQRIRMPEEVLKDKKGTCLDLAILYCACLEEVGYHSILLLIEGHAFAGFFFEEFFTFKNAIETQSGTVFNLSTSTMNKLALIECTSFCSLNETSFNDALALGQANIRKYDKQIFSAIDINHAHKGIFSPISTFGSDQDLELILEPKEITETDIDSVIERKYLNVLREFEKDRFTFWERKLLDLTEANPLVNFKLKSSNCVKMTSDSNIHGLLQSNDSLKFECLKVEKNSITSYSIENEFVKGTTKPSQIFGDSYDKNKLLGIGFEKTLKNLIKKSNSAMDETGAPTLYFCLGTLTYSRKKGYQKGFAPFMVLPIKVTKDKMGPYYTMSYDYDDIMINETFFEYYKQEHPGIDFEKLYKINPTDDYLDIVHTFMENNAEDIQLDADSFFIANLTFAHYIMWQDVRKRKRELKKNEVIHSILENRNLLDDDFNDLEKPIDEVEQYHDFAAPLYYDSTQLRAILKCGEGKSFILDGPPGTGKSQTIVNMIVNAFYHGKTVLFVAEKKAALDVVADRLKKLGDPNSENNLARFCLELHSNKANKSDFFGKLRNSMELGATKDPQDFEKKCELLENKRNELLKIINKMHEKKYYYSLYDAIIIKQSLENYGYKIDLSEQYLNELNQKQIEETYNKIDEYKSTAMHINDFNNNPIKVIQKDNINLYDKEKVVNDFRNVNSLFLDLLENYRKIIGSIGLPYVANQSYIATTIDLIDLCLNSNIYVDAISEYLNISNDEKINEIFKISKQLKEHCSLIEKIFKIASLKLIDYSIALEELSKGQNFIKKIFVNGKYKKILKEVINPGYKINSKNLITLFEYIRDYNIMDNYLIDNNDLISKMIVGDYYVQYKDVNKIESNYIATKEFIFNIKKITDSNNFIEILDKFISLITSNNKTTIIQFTMLKELMNNYIQQEKQLTNYYLIDYKKYENVANNVDSYIDLLNYTTNISNFNDLVDIAYINQLSKELNNLGLEDFINSIILGNIDYNNFREIYDLSCAEGYLKLYFSDSDINYFNPIKFESEVNKYKSLINEYNNLVIESVSAKLTKNLNHQNINYANSSPIGRLKKAISSNGRGVSIRETLLNYDDIIKKYFPCFLMSPLSAAQYLAVDEENNRAVSKFDIVIFDEASQIPTHEAVGPIARGKSLIVAGDPEQMPPSAYFSAGLELAEDEVQYEDAISLLDECIAIELPRIQLAYHYRSKHESLISFSNHNFYKDNLFTFPSPDTKSSMIEYNYVELKENKKDSSIIDDELNAICDSFVDIYKNEKTCLKSVGIIVFNMKQQEKVFDAITELLHNDHILAEQVEKATEKTKESWFVKSLENVQGDERDIIIISIGFRKNAAGRAVVIGPLARENGQRRLNVAVSRSKEKMIVISTIKYTDFDQDNKIKNKGQLMLKRFLQYAENSDYSYNSNNNYNNQSIVSFIKQDLEQRGYSVVENVGNSEFRVDLAIVGENKNMYDLGIILDSKTLGNKISCRDKLYVQDAVLNGLNWKIINIYSLEYHKDREGTINKIIAALDKPFVKNTIELDVHIEKAEEQEFNYDILEYKKYNFPNRLRYFNDTGYSKNIEMFLNNLILQEYPISLETIKERVKEYSNIQSMSEHAKTLLKYYLKKIKVDITYDQNTIFYWPKDVSKIVNKPRKSFTRDIYDISKEEIVKVMFTITDIQGDLSNEDLFRCTLMALEYGQATLNTRNRDRLNYVHNWAIEQGYFKKI